MKLKNDEELEPVWMFISQLDLQVGDWLISKKLHNSDTFPLRTKIVEKPSFNGYTLAHPDGSIYEKNFIDIHRNVYSVEKCKIKLNRSNQ
jgi:hypothetical protein